MGPGDLGLTPAEAAALLRAAEVALGEDEVAELHRRTEGWPVGLYLAALSLREGGPVGTAYEAPAADRHLKRGSCSRSEPHTNRMRRKRTG